MCVIQGLVIASLIPDCEVVICDINKDSIDIAKKRIRDAGLSNVTTICCDIRDLMKEKKKAFTLGIALHACGGLSDLCMKLCCESNAAFVVCPCCVGKLKHTCAKSKFFRDRLDEKSYGALIRAADWVRRFSHIDIFLEIKHTQSTHIFRVHTRKLEMYVRIEEFFVDLLNPFLRTIDYSGYVNRTITM